MAISVRHSTANRDQQNQNGLFIPNLAVFARSGSLNGITGSTTGSVSLSFDARAVRVRRVEVFHSGTASSFHVNIESSTPNTGSDYDPRNTIVAYQSVPGSMDYSGRRRSSRRSYCVNKQ